MRLSKREKKWTSIFFVAAFAFLFFVPIIYVLPQGVFYCPVNGCNFPEYGSATYWAFKVGGVWMEKGYYVIVL